MPFIKDCLTETTHTAYNPCSEPIAVHENDDNMLPCCATMTYIVH
jgi:hypothetical protein